LPKTFEALDISTLQVLFMIDLQREIFSAVLGSVVGDLQRPVSWGSAADSLLPGVLKGAAVFDLTGSRTAKPLAERLLSHKISSGSSLFGAGNGTISLDASLS
jgi:hypothetical protein